MAFTSDWHIHSRNSCDAASMTMERIIADTAARGIVACGVTDHLHSEYNLPDLVASREEYTAADPPPGFHFGVEVSCVSAWELDEIAAGRCEQPTYGIRSGGPPGAEPGIALTPSHVETLRIEYVIGGTHWPLYVPFEREAVISDYHRQNMFLAAHPLVDLVAHPWWWMGHWKGADGVFHGEPWFDDFGAIPAAMHDEFAGALIENGTACEANVNACILNRHYPERWRRQYVAYLASLKAKGVALALGSDCHSAAYDADLESAARLLESVGIGDQDFRRLPPRPADGPAAPRTSKPFDPNRPPTGRPEDSTGTWRR